MEEQLSFMERYNRDHQHPMNKLTHAIGIPPSFLKNPVFLLVGPLWIVKKLFRFVTGKK